MEYPEGIVSGELVVTGCPDLRAGFSMSSGYDLSHPG